jgi:imidazolonepropionase-like amidohydrolase
MTVTGHVPQALTTRAGIEAGMDQINHLNYVTSMLRAPGATGAPDLQSDAAKQAIQFLLDHHTVVDPTASWGEMGGHSKEVPVEVFEPGILAAPAILDAKFRAMENASTADQMHARIAQTETVIAALDHAGVTIVAGSDTGLVAYGLHRELEIYNEAGLTPLEVIQLATIGSARAMGLDRDSGTVEAGKRADLILVDGDPLKDIKNLRRVTRVVADGRVYDAAALWRSVGFHSTPR